jgi:hypothetical protein
MVEVLKKEICSNCMYQLGCNRGIYPELEQVNGCDVIKCAYYERMLSDAEYSEILTRARNQEYC